MWLFGPRNWKHEVSKSIRFLLFKRMSKISENLAYVEFKKFRSTFSQLFVWFEYWFLFFETFWSFHWPLSFLNSYLYIIVIAVVEFHLQASIAEYVFTSKSTFPGLLLARVQGVRTNLSVFRKAFVLFT